MTFYKSKSRQFLDSQSQMVSTEAYDKVVNKNIENLKKIHKTNEMFNKFYAALNQITNEKDFNAMNFAVNKKFHDVKNLFDEDSNFQLIHLIIESDGSSKYNYNILKNSDFNRFIIKTNDINTALINASMCGYHEIVKLLLTVPGIDINAKGSSNKTALILASVKGHHEVVKLLLTVPGFDVNAKDRGNNTSLIWASQEGYYEVVEFLLSVPGIDVDNTVDIKGVIRQRSIKNSVYIHCRYVVKRE